MKKDYIKNSLNIQIGDKIRYYRIKAGMTQEELAEYVDLSQKHISRIESGYHNSHFLTIVAIAKALDVPIDAFVQDIDKGSNTSKIHTIMSEISKMDQYQLEMLEDNIETIKRYKIR